MAPTGTSSAAITPQGIRDGDPAVLAALAARRGPAVVAFAETICEPAYVVRAAADAFARFRAAVADPDLDASVHPDALLLRCARRAALDLAPRGPELGCGPASDLLAQRAERAIKAADATLLNRHLSACEHCHELADNLDAADRAYREADDIALEPATVAPMVAALAAAAPVVLATAEPAAAVVPEPDETPPEEVILDSRTDGTTTQDHSEEPAAEVREEPAAEVREEPELEVTEIPIGTRRVTGAPASYYELPPLEPRERGARTKKALSGAAAAGGLAAGLTKRARKAAAGRLGRGGAPAHSDPLAPGDPLDAAQAPEAHDPEPTAHDPVSTAHAPEPTAHDPEPTAPPAAPESTDSAWPAAAGPQTQTWAPVDSIAFPASPPVAAPEPVPVIADEEYDPDAPDDPELRESAARAAARHYRRLRHRSQAAALTPTGRPPQLLRPIRDRGPHLPLSAHGPRDLALPAGLVVIAALVVMAVSGVFGGGSSTPATGTQANSAPEISIAAESWTHLSLADAERVAARAAGSSATAP